MERHESKSKIIELIVEASDGEVTAQALDEAGGSLEQAGMSSLSFLVLVELLEVRLGVVIDPELDPQQLLTVSGIVDFVAEQMTPATEDIGRNIRA